MQIASRAEKIEPFYVMEVAKAAAELGRAVADTDAPMVFLNIGEPDFTAPPLVQEAAVHAVHQGHTQYTPATGLGPLRERISAWASGAQWPVCGSASSHGPQHCAYASGLAFGAAKRPHGHGLAPTSVFMPWRRAWLFAAPAFR